MRQREPRLFENWSLYMKIRQVMASAVIYKNHEWYDWELGHAKLFGVLLWHFEAKKKTSFKYSNALNKFGYKRTHNYRLLKNLVHKNILRRDGDGFYTFEPSDITAIERVLSLFKKMDKIGKEESSTEHG